MRKLYLTLLMAVVLLRPCWAQTGAAPSVIGCASGSSITDTYNVPYIIGQPILSNISLVNYKVRLGFPYDVCYLKNTFLGNFACSKGYYSDYISLKWTIGSNANKITNFTISRRPLGSTKTSDYQLLATLDPSVRSWQDTYCEASTMYEYKIYASGIFNAKDSLLLNYTTGIGFRQPTGTATGRITYAGGTAVSGVSVVAQTSPNVPTYGLEFGANSSMVIDETSPHTSLTSDSSFTFQAWIKDTTSTINAQQVIFDKHGTAWVYFLNQNIVFEFNNYGAISLNYAQFKNSYFHLSAVLRNNTLTLQLNDGIKVLQAKQTFANGYHAVDISNNFTIGTDYLGISHFKGVMDEIRIWNIALDSTTIQRDYARVLTGTETGLEAYYQCNEGVGSMAYDLTHSGNSYHSYDAVLSNVKWSGETPAQLAIKGVTDKDGNYIIARIPYSAGGSTYTFTPMMGVHSFNPSQALRYFAAGSDVSNNVDFTDKSSFKVIGRVYYSKTTIPVSSVNVLIDGNLAIKGNKPVATSDSGTFQIDVPIGFHRITLAKTNHTFADGFPTKDYENANGDLDSLFDFQKDITNPIYFYDNTLATLSGRVAGGTREQAKPLGFGLSKSNLGHAKIVLNLQSAVSGARLRNNLETITNSGNASIKSSYVLKDNIVTIYPDTATGEYAVQLPPETFTINSAIAGDLANKNYTFTDNATLKLDINKKDSSMYRFVDSTKVGTKYTYKKDSAKYKYNYRYDFIQRLTPTILVSHGKQSYFGDSMIVLTDNNQKPTDTLKLYNTSTKMYYFGNPIFHQSVDYTFNIRVFEKYENYFTGFVDTIPQSSGDTIIINNNFSTNKSSYIDTLNKKGALQYHFKGGEPNTTTPYTIAASFMYKYRKDNITQKVLAPDITAIILGGKSSGSNFITAGPTKIDMILRDAPGTGSYTFLEKGKTITNYETTSKAFVYDGSNTFDVNLGVETEVATGFGVAIISDMEALDNLKIGEKLSTTDTWNGTTASATTNTEQWQTSADATYVGSMGDVFIGHSTNIVFGKTLNVGVLKDDSGKPILTTGNSYSLSPKFGTFFKYSQNHIKGYLLPNLAKIRENFFAQQPDIYISVKPGIYENTSTKFNADSTILVGDAYNFCPKKQMLNNKSSQASDSVAVYTMWIKEWEKALADNEAVKVEAISKVTPNSENHSFDAGVVYQNTITTSNSTEKSKAFHSETFLTTENTVGFNICGTGVLWNSTNNFGGTYDKTKGEGTDTTTTFGYVLAESNQGSYYSVDVLPASDGFGPVFRTRGGQSYCPYEGEELTQYYEPGKHVLNVATEQMEIPQITINNLKIANQINVPTNSQAYFTLSLKNLSQAGNNVWYDLVVADASNPDGLIIKVDGAPISTKGMSYMVPSLQAITKTLSIAMGKPNVFKYKNVGLVLRSQCQGDPSSDAAVIADTVYVNVEFTPACTKVSLAQPLNQWVMNVDNPNLNVKATDYNMNEGNFQSISLEYKPSSSASWSEADIFFKDTTTSLYKDNKSNKHFLDGSFVLSDYSQYLKLDQKYDIRAKSNCIDGVTAYSEVVSGIKDMKPPHVFGTPQPSNGILGIGQNISVQFDETIEPSKTGVEDVTVSGVLNNSPINHATSLNLDGASGYAKADGFSFTNQPFTIEFWMKRLNQTDTGVIVSRGSTNAEKLEIANTENGTMQVSLGKTVFSSIDPSPCYNTKSPASAWHHYALSYDTTGTVVLYGDDKVLLSKFDVKYSPSERSSLYLGRSVNGNSFGQANVDEVRVWNTARTISDINGNKDVLLSGSQQGLVAYWPLSDGSGNLVADRAGSHSLTVNTSWEIALENKAMNFDASKKQVLFFNGTNLTLSNEQDATIEFWFKAGKQSNRACLFSNGVKDSTAKGANPLAFGLFIEQSGVLTLTSGGVTNNATTASVSDDAWHHFALVIDRLSNVRTYLDGSLQSQLSTTLFQSIVGQQMSIGANHIQVLSDSTVTNHYFTGSIDEFRIWETARKASLINRYKNTKLDGKESGLRYYFPFEAYKTLSGQTIQTLFESIKNNVDSASQIAKKVARTDTVVAKLVNGADYTLQAPAVKDALPKSYLNTSFDINNDELLVNLPKQDAALYENCILDVSVGYVYDKNGNRIASPVQWTAYVDQNPVQWNNKSQTLSIVSGEGATFTVDVINKSGSNKNFNLNGLPAWLTASPDMGTLQPNSSLTVTFTINNGLNVGSYSQSINLTTDYGYDEKLQVDVTVKAQAPNWTVDASKYQYMMNLFGKLSIDGVIATNENTLLAAFVNGECRGVTSLKYLSNFDLTEAMLSIYSNSDQGETIELRIWDANTGKTYSNVTPIYTFVSDKVFGTPKVPELISCDNTLLNTYSLGVGWNWISVNVKNAKSNAVNNLFSSIGSTGDEIKSQKKGFDKFSKLAGWSGSLDTTSGINPAEMYKMKLTKAGVVTIGGKPVNATTTTLPISKGWNWIGFIPQYNVTVNEALASYGPVDGDLVKSQKAFSMYYTGIGWIGSLTVLEPGKGYMLQSANASSLVYPELGLLKNNIEQLNEQVPKVLVYTGGQAQSNSTVLAQLADESIEIQGKVLAAYSGNTCVGYASAINSPSGKPLFFITADESSKLEFALVDVKTGLKTSFVNSLTTSSDSHIGQIDKPYLLYTSKSESNIDGETEIVAYPNPFQSTLVIQGNLLQDSPLNIRMFNDLGKELLTFNTSKTKGSYTIDLSSQTSFDKLPQGVYVVEVRSNDGTKHISVIKQ